jgi:multidrug efflux pump subunit AcrA (membrane-fusion protein)
MSDDSPPSPRRRTTARLVARPAAPPVSERPLATIPVLTSRSVVKPTPLAPLLEELNSIVSRPTEDIACRDALLDCVARHRLLLGGAWYHTEGDAIVTDARRFPGGAFDRVEVRQWLESVAAQCLAEGKPIAVESPQFGDMAVIAVIARPNPAPADWSGPTPVHTLVLLIPNSSTRSTDSELLAAECVARAWNGWFEWRASRMAHERLRATAALVELIGQVNSAATLRLATQTVATEFHQLIECQFVAICLIAPRQSTAHFASTSGLGDVNRFTPLVERLEAAANEAVVRGEPVFYPERVLAAAAAPLALRKAAETLQVESIATIPLRDESARVVGALVCGGTARTLLSPATMSLLQASTLPLGAALAAARRMEGGWVARLRRRFVAYTESRARSAWIAAALLATLVLLYPAHYRPRGRAVVEPVERRYALAPHEGLVENTFVEPGDSVEAGQVVARMDGRELRWELAGVIADEQRRAKERDVRLSSRQVADSILSTLEMEQLAARRQLLEHRLANLEIRSPIQGVVLTGATDQRRNYPVDKGHTLYEFAELNPMRIEIAIPASELPHIHVGQLAQVQINGETGLVRTGEITRIRPQSEIRHELNVFVAEVEMENSDLRLRPGMEGAARIVGDRRPLAWHWGHRLCERILAVLWW